MLSVQGGVVVFAPIGATSASVPYGNAYMNATPVGEARSLNIVFGDETTGVNEELRMKNLKPSRIGTTSLANVLLSLLVACTL